MRVLFDTNTPAPLARWLRAHTVTRAATAGWESVSNGALLDEAERAGFDLIVTCDRNIEYQQNLTGRKIALVILSTNKWADIQRVAMKITAIIDFVQSGQLVRVDVAALERD